MSSDTCLRRVSHRRLTTDKEVKLEGFGINIANVDASLMGKEDGVALAAGIDADVILGV